MADTPPTTSPLGSSPPSSAAEQARIRRERREAKIKAGGTSRLNKITGLGGGLQRDNKPAIAISEIASISHSDPEEVDISKHFYEPTQNPGSGNGNPNVYRPNPDFSSGSSQMDDHAVRSVMFGLTGPGESRQSDQSDRPRNPFAEIDNPESVLNPAASDPMMTMLQQILGGTGDEPGTVPSFPGLPTVGVPDQKPNEAAPTTDTFDYIWRFVHAIFALGFGMYIVSTAGFIDSIHSGYGRDAYSETDLRAFYTFATLEAILQGTRLMFDKGRTNQNGLMQMLLRFLPEPFGAYLKIFMNYRNIWATTSADIMVLVFVIVTAYHWRAS